ncbi:MAG: TRAFs-binding domain-containing protein, partial [Synechococcaceae cyanobacterium]
AMAHYDTLLASHAEDAETWALAARVHKDDWVANWRQDGFDPARKQEEALDSIDTLRQAQDHYLRGFRADPTHYYSGINALTLMHLEGHLDGAPADEATLATLAGAVRFAAESANTDAHGDPSFWALATLGDLAVLEGTAAEATAAYRKAISLRETDRFALNSCRAQLLLLQDLGFRPDVVAAAIASLDRALARSAPQQATWQPRLVLLFSGHMMDAPSREKPRFPPALEAAATQRIEAALAELEAGADDLALCQAASGGDLLFLEACQRRRVRCQVLLPFEEAEFIQRSVVPSIQGDRWRQRYYAMRDQLDPSLPIRIMAEELGPSPSSRSPYERCNDWLLYSALAYGIERLRFLCLWDGEGGDGRGGTAHMVRVVEERTGRVIRIDTHDLTPT